MYIIDRFEAEFAILEDQETKKFINVKKNLLPINCKEGDIILQTINGYELDLKSIDQRRQNINEKFKNLKRKN